MATANATSTRAATASRSKRPSELGPILLATDGTTSSDPAFVATRLLATRTGQHVHVLTVFDPAPLLALYPVPVMPLHAWDVARVEQMLDELKLQVRERMGEHITWGTEVRLGSPAATIARTAKELHAALIVTGLSRHGLRDRLLGGETPRHVAQLADVPVLAAASTFERLPERVLVALDFESGSIQAALRALELFPGVGSVCLAHVKPHLSPMMSKSARWDQAYEEGVASAFERVKAQLPGGPRIETITLTGDPAREVLDFAEYSHAELIVAGTHQRGAFRRVLLGSVAGRLLRGATTSVLIVPPDAAHDLGHSSTLQDLLTETLTDRDQWPNALREFNRRNAGRRVVLEIDEREIGAQAQVVDFPLVGVDLDRLDGHVEVMLGGTEARAPHLTHRVTEATSIDILRTANGDDRALRIAHPGGHALLLLP